MINVSLFRRTLSSYEASIIRGESCTLYKYCKIHHVNYQGLRYWMIKESIALPDQNLSKVVASSTCAPQQMVPLTIISPQESKEPVLPSPHLQEVSITITDGMVVRIKEISPADLASLILSCQIR